MAEGPLSASPLHPRRSWLRAARLMLLWERLWPRLWPVLGTIGLFVSVTLLDLLPLLPALLHALALAALGGALYATLRHAARADFHVAETLARHRVERDSGLAHRPLTALDDRLAAGSDAVWQTHLQRAATAAERLRIGLPAPGMAVLDPWGLRAVVVLLVVIGAAAGHGDEAGRFARALVPAFGGAAETLSVEVWITPPAYTGRPPLHLDAKTREAVNVPVGSTVLVQAGGIDGRPRLLFGSQSIEFTSLDSGDRGRSFRAEATLDGGERLSVVAGYRTLAEWPLVLIADHPPAVTFTGEPELVGLTRFSVSSQAEDDYGVAGLAALIRRPGGKETARLPLHAPRNGTPHRSIHDLTAHPWAGLDVEVQLEATDTRAQKGFSGTIPFRLPERAFTHPVAREIIAVRRALASAHPPARPPALTAIDQITAEPERFDGDTVVFLALRVARARLLYDVGDHAVEPVLGLLWGAALRLEDGRFSLAERSFRDACERLAEAMNSGDRTKIEETLELLRQALENYAAALGERLTEKGLTVDPTDAAGDFLRDALQMIEDLVRAGDLEAARRLLADLSRRVEGMGAALDNQHLREEVEAARKMAETLRELAGRQEELLNRTFDRRRREDLRDLGSDRTAQETLRRDLGTLLGEMDRTLGAIPDAFAKAERAMKAAGHALGNQRLDAATVAQGKALDHLREGKEAMAEALARRLGGLPGVMRLPGGRDSPGDPYGRGMPPAGLEGSVEIPGQAERRRVHDILKELRRRAGDRTRPEIEREYLERLLRRF